MLQQDGTWHVSAFLDMEVASAGDCIADLVSLCISLAQVLPVTSRWWEPLFAGYGQEPDFAGLSAAPLRRLVSLPATHLAWQW
ncbi:hypothetical protein [Dictyobacter kobayashii]|uniref:Aminoglycoside phosphotransferase domain-containing protein n=1 Tax=Dictyobacter kobayashii TaxID=2014872 RepID=A0A402AQR2_9CHLR|nr:hypothetical protein [Dictyobacter kobayashii]GCE21432.1 hypothetical protein KDK_52320 [Dictyobacter kobayashii]